jgi:hypothetical protein
LAERLFKFLAEGAVSRFSGFVWPALGEWVSVDGPLGLCVSGFHVCRIRDLPYWLDDELWEVEVGGDWLDDLEQLVVRRARLVSRVEAWPDPFASELAAGCLRELRRLAARELELSNDPDAAELSAVDNDLEAARAARRLAERDRAARTAVAIRLLVLLADAGDIAADPSAGRSMAGRYIAYIAAHAADHATPEHRLPPGATGFSEERRRQADELARALER